MGLNWVFFDKLREWVGTVTGKGVRWGRDRVGRSAPTFMAASTTALPPLTCMARGRTSSAAVVLAARPAVGWLFFEACAGRSVCRLCCLQCLVQRAFVCLLCLPCPLPSSSSCPRQHLCPRPFHFCLLAPVHSMCARIVLCQGQQFASCKTVLLAAATRACSGGPCAGSI